MLNEQDGYTQFKLDILKRAMPAETAIVYGDIYRVDGGYTAKCLEYGCKNVLLVDTIETVRFQKLRIENPALDFIKGDFSNALFMQSFDSSYDIGVVYDILLHQAPMLGALHLMLHKVRQRFCIVQPMLREQTLPNSLIYLPGNTRRDLYPLPEPNKEYCVFDPYAVNHSQWLWGMTVSFLRSALLGEGYEVIYEAEFRNDFLTNEWFLWGGIAERRQSVPKHWSFQRPNPALHDIQWDGPAADNTEQSTEKGVGAESAQQAVIAQLTADLRQASVGRDAVQAELLGTRKSLDSAEETVSQIRNSVSWKITEPARRIMSALRSGPRNTKRSPGKTQ